MEAPALLPKQRLGPERDIVEGERADLRGALAHLVLLAPAHVARRIGVDEEDAHAALAGRRIGAGEDDGEVGDRRVVDPDLLAGEPANPEPSRAAVVRTPDTSEPASGSVMQ